MDVLKRGSRHPVSSEMVSLMSNQTASAGIRVAPFSAIIGAGHGTAFRHRFKELQEHSS
jgi:hypothetical protein